MSIRSTLAKTAGKATKTILEKTRSGGSSMPGKVALKLDPNILATLAKDYRTVIVTGTNGKTLTTSFITKIFKEKYGQVLTNPTGANLLQGIISCFLGAPKQKVGTKYAVLEVDEATLKHVTRYIRPEVIVFTNLFRDQMDRYGEIYTTYSSCSTAPPRCQRPPSLPTAICRSFPASRLTTLWNISASPTRRTASSRPITTPTAFSARTATTSCTTSS